MTDTDIVNRLKRAERISGAALYKDALAEIERLQSIISEAQDFARGCEIASLREETARAFGHLESILNAHNRGDGDGA